MVSMPRAIGERVVKGVARERDGIIDVDHTVVPVTTEEVPVKSGSSIAGDMHGLGNVLLKTCNRHDDLEGASWGELGLNGFIQ